MQILQSAAEADLGIIYNCARNYPLPGFYLSRFSWGKILCHIGALYQMPASELPASSWEAF